MAAALLGVNGLRAAGSGEWAGPAPDLADLARRSAWVVHGKVAALAASRDAEGRVYTRVDLDSAEFWKGEPTNHFSLVLAGGVLGQRKVTYTGQPEYALGEEVVVFAGRNPHGLAVTLDLGYGKYVVSRASGVPLATSSIGGGAPAPLSDLRKRAHLP